MVNTKGRRRTAAKRSKEVHMGKWADKGEHERGWKEEDKGEEEQKRHT